MSITLANIEKVAHLARIAIDEATITATTKRFSNVLDMVNQLQTVDTSNIQPLAHPLDAVQRIRTDEVTEINQRELLLRNAPATEAGLFLVPKVIE